ncbi:MAG TPA: GGDEF domain-containing protein [Pirellulaceae bacterium]
MISLPHELLRSEVLLWILFCVLVSMGIGAVMGRGLALRYFHHKMQKERQSLVKALQVLLESTDQLSLDVGTHKSELADVEQTVVALPVDSDFEAVQQVFLEQINAVVESHKRLEDDLVVTRYQLVEQSQELDTARVEARTDELSGLSNRKAFDEALQFAISSFKRKGTSFALALADVDHFKRINDVHGHDSGDRVVARVGDVLRDHCRGHDLVARFGGDEFAVIFTKVNQEQADVAANRLWAAIGRTNFDVGLDGARIAVTFSMGLAYPQIDDSVETIFKRADQALYRAKQGGRNRLCTFLDSSQSTASGSESPSSQPSSESNTESVMLGSHSREMLPQSV